MQRNALVVFAKTPRPGASKTRLVPPLTFEDAAALSAAFIADVATTVAEVAARTGATPCTAYDGDVDEMRVLVGDVHLLVPQRGVGFGARLRNVATDMFALGFQSVCLIGSDSPTLPARCLDAALAELERPGDRIVLGPAEDGGYYLLGIKTLHGALFGPGIAWSTDGVALQTIEAARACGIEPAVIERWYDVDDADSLERLRAAFLLPEPRAASAPVTRARVARIAIPAYSA